MLFSHLPEHTLDGVCYQSKRATCLCLELKHCWDVHTEQARHMLRYCIMCSEAYTVRASTAVTKRTHCTPGHGVICTLRYNTLRWQQKGCRAHNERVCPPKAFMNTLAPRNKFSILVGPKCALLSFSPSLPEGSKVCRHSTAPSTTKGICCTQDYCF